MKTRQLRAFADNEGQSEVFTDALRFAVGDSDGQIVSDIWRVWPGKNNRDFYISSHGLRTSMKVSVHPTVVQFGFSSWQVHADAVANGVTRLGRFARRIDIPTLGLGEKWTALWLTFPREQLRSVPRDGGSENVRLLSVPRPGHCLRVAFLLVRDGTNFGWNHNTATYLGRVYDGADRHLCVVAAELEVDEEEYRAYLRDRFAACGGVPIHIPTAANEITCIMTTGDAQCGPIEVTELHQLPLIL